MRRITLLLMVMAAALLAVSGVAWAATKTCPPEPKVCKGTSGADVLKSTSSGNIMVGQGGNDTYTNFARGNSGRDVIDDAGGKDKLVLTGYKGSEVYLQAEDVDENGKADSLVLFLGKGNKNYVVLVNYFDNRKTLVDKPNATYPYGIGRIENILVK